MSNENTYKTLDSTDIVNSRTMLHEAIPLTGTIVSGTYGDANIKDYAHGMFQSVYDYPYLSSSANHIFDITVGVGAMSALYSSVVNQKSKKANIYNQLAQVLMGYDITGSIQRFDEDGTLIDGGSGGTKLDNVFALTFARLLSKDEIKKGTFELELGVSASYAVDGTVFDQRIKITDFNATDSFKVNSPAGEYGILYATASADKNTGILPQNQRYAVGLLFYQAGIAIISGSVFNVSSSEGGGILDSSHGEVLFSDNGTGENFDAILTGSQISGACDNIRNRIYNIQFNNTVELNSSIYFCRANNNQFNYSTNPTYLTQSTIRVKQDSNDNPVSYITTVGLYNNSNELMAVAKLSEPLKKTPDTEFTIRVRLDY